MRKCEVGITWEVNIPKSQRFWFEFLFQIYFKLKKYIKFI